MKAVAIPAGHRARGSRWRPAPAPLDASRRNSSIGTRWPRGRAGGCRQLLARHPRPQPRSTRASSTRPASGVDALRFPDDLATLPLTTKAELVADQAANPPWGTALTEPLERYTRYCQTSSTTGRPLRWIDTNESWQWMLDCWKAVYRGRARRAGRSRVLSVLVRSVPRLLGRLRGRLPDGPALRARRRHVEPASAWR